jgi:hypothetical protein
MVEYECEKCRKKFNILSSFQDHILSNKGCEKQLKKQYSCENCEKNFTTDKAKKYHMIVSCKNKIDINKLQEEEIKKMKERIEILEKTKRKPGRPKKIQNNIMNNSNNTNIGKQENTNIGTINNQNITIIDYGNEDISMLTLEEKKAILNAKYDAIRKCAEIMHCNPNHPEMRNVLISNLRANIGQQYKKGKFRIKSKDELLEDVIRDKANNVQDILEEGLVSISKIAYEKICNLLELINEDDKKQMSELKIELEHLLYEENRDINKSLKNI